jgi:hypothetical protein
VHAGEEHGSQALDGLDESRGAEDRTLAGHAHLGRRARRRPIESIPSVLYRPDASFDLRSFKSSRTWSSSMSTPRPCTPQ